MTTFLYHGSYTHADEDTAMLFVARAYAIGDIYCVPELKDHAAAQFKELASARWDTPDFAHATRVIYESIPENGRGGMRDIAAHVAAQHHEVLLRVPDFQDTLDDFGALGKDLLQALSKQLVDSPRVCKYVCPSTGDFGEKHIAELVVSNLNNPSQWVICPRCSIGYNKDQWYEYADR